MSANEHEKLRKVFVPVFNLGLLSRDQKPPARVVVAAFREKTVDNYIVRIYRREKDNPRLLVGLIEEVGVSGKKAFNNLDDLWEILNRQKKGTTENQKYQSKRNRKGRLNGAGRSQRRW